MNLTPRSFSDPCLRQPGLSGRPRMPISSLLTCRQDHDFYAGRILLRAVDGLRGFLVVGFLGFENIGHEFLRVAVVQREPSALYLHHDAVAFFEDVVGGVQVYGEWRNLIWRDG